MDGAVRRGRVTTVIPRPRDVVDLTLSDSDEELPPVGRGERFTANPSRSLASSTIQSNGFDSEEEELAIAMSLSQQTPTLPKAHSVISIGDSSDDEADGGSMLGKRGLSSERVDSDERNLLLAMQRSEYEEALQEDQRKEREAREAEEASQRAEAEELTKEKRRKQLAEVALIPEAGEGESDSVSLSIRLPGKARAQAERRFPASATWGDAKAWAASEVAKDESLATEQMWWPEHFELALSYPLTVLSADLSRQLGEDTDAVGNRARLQLHRN